MIRAIPEIEIPKIEEEMMKRNIALDRLSHTDLGRMVKLGAVMLTVMICSHVALAQETGPKKFSSPGEAAHALFLAVRNEDEEAVGAILGAGKELTSSNDQLEDKLERERFSQKYQQMHRLVQEPDGTTVLYIGAENWPFPIPLAAKDGRWYFDVETGVQEILFRKIGENESNAIEVCRAFAAARKQQNQHAAIDDPIREYGEQLVTARKANSEKTAITLEEQSEPFRGYYFRTMNNTRGLALVAYPAEYRSSGVMTFVVTQDGAVEERDLGPDTPRLAPNLRKLTSGFRAAE